MSVQLPFVDLFESMAKQLLLGLMLVLVLVLVLLMRMLQPVW
jgi:hypothetical protein